MKKIALFLLLSLSLFADLNLPNLSGRVVDEAKLLNNDAKSQIEQISKNLEQNSTTQLVIAIVNSLQGSDIQSYGIALAREWKLGVKGKDNGVILLVAPNERELRIEVGYGLEGVLTDALASRIINHEILPYFKKGEYENGVINGAEKIALVISGVEFKADEAENSDEKHLSFAIVIFVFFGFTFLSNFMKFEKLKHISRAGLLSSFASFFSYVFANEVTQDYAHIIGVVAFIVGFIFFYPFVKKYKNDSSSGGFGESNDFSGEFGSNNMGFSRSSRGDSFGGKGGGFGGGGASGRW